MQRKSHFAFPGVVIFILILLSGKQAFSQTPESYIWEPEFSLVLPTEGYWSYSFGLANRTVFAAYERDQKIEGSSQEHFELNQFTFYKTGMSSAVGLGFRYRFRETFNENNHDEFRIIQQFTYSHPESFLSLAHRFRFEQRFRDLTIFRLRYRLGISRPMGEDFGIGLSTEFLYSMIKGFKPAPDQRFTLMIDNFSFPDLELSAGIEMQRENYTNAPKTEYFLLTAVTYNL